MLALEQKLVYEVNYSLLESVIYSAYPILREYAIPCGEEAGNDVCKRYYVTGKLDDKDDWEDIITASNPKDAAMAAQYRLNLLLNKLAQDGHIPTGVYYVSISW